MCLEKVVVEFCSGRVECRLFMGPQTADCPADIWACIQLIGWSLSGDLYWKTISEKTVVKTIRVEMFQGEGVVSELDPVVRGVLLGPQACSIDDC